MKCPSCAGQTRVKLTHPKTRPHDQPEKQVVVVRYRICEGCGRRFYTEETFDRWSEPSAKAAHPRKPRRAKPEEAEA